MEFRSYDIRIRIDDSEKKFTGEEKVKLGASNEKLFLNAVDINVHSVKVNGSDVPFSVSEDEEKVNIEGTYNGETEIECTFGGDIKNVLMGLYYSTTSSGTFYTTQFESTGARRVFPCMDNPGYKAEFNLTLEVKQGLDAISNMPVKSRETSEGITTYVFETTPRMSTYLLYMGVGNFDEARDKYRDIDLVLAAPKGHLGEKELPMQFAKDAIKNFEEYFGINYVLPKMHLISVPDFGAGAMENWGAITFREVLLNVSENTSTEIKRTIDEVISHEIAHQWFGNLVTMKWWNDLWLNESFATFMSYKTVDRFHKEWDMWGVFVLSETAGAMNGDALRGSHPIDAKVESPNDVEQIFDEISYGKGASILRMIESFVGEENFRDGIRQYLSEHKFGNAVGSDLWTAIAGISKMPVQEIMSAWISKQGYPVVFAQKHGDRIKLVQKRFLMSGEETDDLWPIPLTVRRKGGEESVLFKGREMEIDAGDFIKLNVDQTGFYRVSYSDDLFSGIAEEFASLSDLDKYGIVSDLFAFLSAGTIGVDGYMDRIMKFTGDESPLVAEALSGHLFTLSLMLPERKDVSKKTGDFISAQLERIGEKKEGEEDRISIMRGVLARSGIFVNDMYAGKLSVKFDNFTKSDPDMRRAVAEAFAMTTNDLDAMVLKLTDMKSEEDRIKIIGAMGWLKGDKHMEEVMELIEEDVIRKQDMVRFFVTAAMNPETRDFLLKNYEKIVAETLKYFVGTGYGSMLIESTIPYLGLLDYNRAKEVAEKVRQPETQTGIEKGLELLDVFSRIRKKAGY